MFVRSLRNKLFSSKVAINALWVIVCKVIQSLLGFAISMISARYLGPSNYGIIAYASSVTLFFQPIAELGFNSILIRELTHDPNKEGKILGTCIASSAFTSILCIFGILAFTYYANPGEVDVLVVTGLYSLMLFFRAFELIQYWYQYRLWSKYFSVVSLIAYVVVSVYKLFLLITQKSIYWFAVSTSIDYFLISASLILLFKKKTGLKFEFSFSYLRLILKKSIFYIISNLMVVIFAQTDKIMLKMMIGNEAAGYYTAAATIAGLLSFVYAAIMHSCCVPIYKFKKENDDKKFEEACIRLYSIMIYLSFFQSIGMCLLARPIIMLSYGCDYADAIPILAVLVWYTTFAYYGNAKDIWMIAEGKEKWLLLLNGAGAFTNIAMNFMLIPVLGEVGAAIASLISFACSNILFLFFIKPLRRNQVLLSKALNPKNILNLLK